MECILDEIYECHVLIFCVSQMTFLFVFTILLTVGSGLDFQVQNKFSLKLWRHYFIFSRIQDC